MGEISEMMLEGILCEGCGEFMGGAPGYPQRCAGCEPRSPKRPLLTYGAERGLKYNRERHDAAKSQKPFECDVDGCKKLCRTAGGLAQHKRDKHS